MNKNGERNTRVIPVVVSPWGLVLVLESGFYLLLYVHEFPAREEDAQGVLVTKLIHPQEYATMTDLQEAIAEVLGWNE